MLIGVMRLAPGEEPCYSLVEYQCQVLQRCDLLPPTSTRSTLENVLERLIAFRKEWHRHQPFLVPFDVDRSTRLDRTVLTEISECLLLNDVINAFSIEILPLLREAHSKVHLNNPSKRFGQMIPQHLDPKEVSSVRFTDEFIPSTYAFPSFHAFDQLRSLSVLNLLRLSDVGHALQFMPTVRSVSLWFDDEFPVFFLKTLLWSFCESITRLEIRCAGARCDHSLLDYRQEDRFVGSKSIMSFIFDIEHYPWYSVTAYPETDASCFSHSITRQHSSSEIRRQSISDPNILPDPSVAKVSHGRRSVRSTDHPASGWRRLHARSGDHRTRTASTTIRNDFSNQDRSVGSGVLTVFLRKVDDCEIKGRFGERERLRFNTCWKKEKCVTEEKANMSELTEAFIHFSSTSSIIDVSRQRKEKKWVCPDAIQTMIMFVIQKERCLLMMPMSSSIMQTQARMIFPLNPILVQRCNRYRQPAGPVRFGWVRSGPVADFRPVGKPAGQTTRAKPAPVGSMDVISVLFSSDWTWILIFQRTDFLYKEKMTKRTVRQRERFGKRRRSHTFHYNFDSIEVQIFGHQCYDKERKRFVRISCWLLVTTNHNRSRSDWHWPSHWWSETKPDKQVSHDRQMASNAGFLSTIANIDSLDESKIRQKIYGGELVLIENRNKTLSLIWSKLRLIADSSDTEKLLEGWVACRYCESVFRTHSKLKSDGTRKNYGLTTPTRHLDVCKNYQQGLVNLTINGLKLKYQVQATTRQQSSNLDLPENPLKMNGIVVMFCFVLLKSIAKTMGLALSLK